MEEEIGRIYLLHVFQEYHVQHKDWNEIDIELYILIWMCKFSEFYIPTFDFQV